MHSDGAQSACFCTPGGGGLALHLLAVPDLHGSVIGAGGENGVLVRDADAVDGRLVLVQVCHQQPFGVPTCQQRYHQLPSTG